MKLWKEIEKNKIAIGDYIVCQHFYFKEIIMLKIKEIGNDVILTEQNINFEIPSEKSIHCAFNLIKYVRYVEATPGDILDGIGLKVEVIKSNENSMIVRNIKNNNMYHIEKAYRENWSVTGHRDRNITFKEIEKEIEPSDIVLFKDIYDNEYLGMVLKTESDDVYMVHESQLCIFKNNISTCGKFKILRIERIDEVDFEDSVCISQI